MFGRKKRKKRKISYKMLMTINAALRDGLIDILKTGPTGANDAEGYDWSVAVSAIKLKARMTLDFVNRYQDSCEEGTTINKGSSKR